MKRRDEEHRKPSVLTTYADLAALARNFTTNQKMHSLVIFSTPGLAKSTTFQSAIPDGEAVMISGRLSAFQLFKTLQDHLHQLFVFDDTRDILRNSECVNLLMQLGQPLKNVQDKAVHWHTDKTDGNTNFTTQSRQAILINRLHSSADIDPIVSRSLVYRFQPSKQEVHEYVGRWFPTTPQRKAIYKFIGQHLDMITIPDIRDYVKTEAEMAWTKNWQKNLLESWNSEPYAVAALQVRNNKALRTKQQKGDEFKRLCGGSPSQLYWWLAKLSR